MKFQCKFVIKSEKRKKSFIFKVMSNRKALSALNTHQSALRPTASLYSGKTNTKRSAAVQKNSARKVIGNDINNLDCDKLSIDGELLQNLFLHVLDI